MQYLIALDPQLNLTAAEFADAWNASDYTAQGAAAAGEAPGQIFLPLEVSVALISAAASIPATIIATFVSDYLKHKFIEGDKPEVTVTTISTPDGRPVWIVKQEKK